MKNITDTLIDDITVVTSSYVSEPIEIKYAINYAIQIAFSAATSGSIYLEVSCDEPNINHRSPDLTSISTWSTIDGSVTPLNGSGTGLFDIENTGNNWVRIHIIGPVTINSLRVNAKCG